MDQCLLSLVYRGVQMDKALTLLTMMPPRLCATNMIGRFIDYSYFSSCIFGGCHVVPRAELLLTLVNCRFRHKSEINVRA
jgi:hypothetical protein